jgi:hypothetical protein
LSSAKRLSPAKRVSKRRSNKLRWRGQLRLASPRFRAVFTLHDFRHADQKLFYWQNDRLSIDFIDWSKVDIFERY